MIRDAFNGCGTALRVSEGLHRMLVGFSVLPTMGLDVLHQADFHASQLDGGPLLSTYKKLVFFRELHSAVYMFYAEMGNFHGAALDGGMNLI